MILIRYIGTLLSLNHLTWVQQLVPQEGEGLVAGRLREDVSCVEGCVNLRQLELTTGDPLPDPVISDADAAAAAAASLAALPLLPVSSFLPSSSFPASSARVSGLTGEAPSVGFTGDGDSPL